MTKRTIGRPSNPDECYVYVGVAKRGVKIGISSNPEKRTHGLGCRLVCAVPVVFEAARDVEGLALTMLGRHNADPGEWAIATPEEAERAVRAAMAAVARFRHADPAITAEEARQQRIGLHSSAG